MLPFTSTRMHSRGPAGTAKCAAFASARHLASTSVRACIALYPCLSGEAQRLICLHTCIQCRLLRCSTICLKLTFYNEAAHFKRQSQNANGMPTLEK